MTDSLLGFNDHQLTILRSAFNAFKPDADGCIDKSQMVLALETYAAK